MNQPGMRHKMILLLLAFVAFALRVYRLDAPALRGDEACTLYWATDTLDEIFSLYVTSMEPHPPFLYLLLHYWCGSVGETEFAFRFISVWTGMLAVPLIYALGRLLWDRRVGLVATALLAFNPFHIWHAQEARMYAMLATFSLASVISYWMVLRRGGWGWWLAYGLITALSMYTHYYAFLVVAFQGLYAILGFIFGRSDRTDLRGRALPLGRWIAGMALAGLLYLPWFLPSWSVLSAYRGSARSSIPFFEPVYRSLLVFGQGQTLPRRIELWFLPLWGGLLIGGWVAAWLRDRGSAAFTSLYFLVPWTVIFVDSLRRPVFDERYFMVSTPPYYLLIALALAGLYRWRRQSRVGSWLAGGVAALIVGVCSGSLYNHYHVPAYARAPDWRSLNDFYVRHVREGDVVIANLPDPATRYYYDFGVPWTILPESYPVDREATIARLDELVRTHPRVWLTPQRWSSWDQEGLVERWLDAETERVMEYQVDSFRVSLYHTPRQFREEMRPLDARLGGSIHLLGYVVRDDGGRATDRLQARPGDQVRLTLYWQADSRIGEDYVVFTHLLDATGWLRGQQDNQPRQGTLPTRAWTPGVWVVDAYRIPVPADAPVGDYLLEIGMYRPGDGKRLQVSGRDTDPENHRILVRDRVSVH